MAYAASTDLVARFDDRVLKALALDTGSPETDLTSNTRIAAVLDDASGKVDAALLMGGRYTTVDLEALAGNNLSLLKRVTCSIAVGFLLQSRGYTIGDKERATFLQAFEEGMEWLDKLAQGLDIFNIERIVEAGKPVAAGPTTRQLNLQNFIVDQARARYYPTRHLPKGR